MAYFTLNHPEMCGATVLQSGTICVGYSTDFGTYMNLFTPDIQPTPPLRVDLPCRVRADFATYSSHPPSDGLRFFTFNGDRQLIIVAGTISMGQRYTRWWLFVYDFASGTLTTCLNNQRCHILIPEQIIGESMTFTVLAREELAEEREQKIRQYSVLHWTFTEQPGNIVADDLIDWKSRDQDNIFLLQNHLLCLQYFRHRGIQPQPGPIVSSVVDASKAHESESWVTREDPNWHFPELNTTYQRVLYRLTPEGNLLLLKRAPDVDYYFYDLWILDFSADHQWKRLHRLELRNRWDSVQPFSFSLSTGNVLTLINRTNDFMEVEMFPLGELKLNTWCELSLIKASIDEMRSGLYR